MAWKIAKIIGLAIAVFLVLRGMRDGFGWSFWIGLGLLILLIVLLLWPRSATQSTNTSSIVANISSARKAGDKTLRAMGWVAFIFFLIYGFGFLGLWYSKRGEKREGSTASKSGECTVDSTFTIKVTPEYTKYHTRPTGCRFTFGLSNPDDSLEVDTDMGTYQYGPGYPDHPMDIPFNKGRFRSLMADSGHVVVVPIRIHPLSQQPGFQ